jgi:hypothetical protein
MLVIDMLEIGILILPVSHCLDELIILFQVIFASLTVVKSVVKKPDRKDLHSVHPHHS